MKMAHEHVMDDEELARVVCENHPDVERPLTDRVQSALGYFPEFSRLSTDQRSEIVVDLAVALENAVIEAVDDERTAEGIVRGWM